MKILAISGSASKTSSNTLFLDTIKEHFSNDYKIEVYNNLRNLPLFRPEDLDAEIPLSISEIKSKVKEADAIIISTPEYTHNIPAVLKNAIEWMTASGEFENKKVLSITFTPNEPRGEHAMQSLLFSLKTMNARVVLQLPLYKTQVDIVENKMTLGEELLFMISEGLKRLV